jgi:hypothetical protein
VKSAATASAIAAAVPRKAQPSRPKRFAASAATNAAAATTDSAIEPALARRTAVQTRNATATAAVKRPMRPANRFARTRMSPVVFRATNTAPCVTNNASVVNPARIAYGFSRVQKLPVYSNAALIGTPRTMLPNATPQRIAGSSEPTKIARSNRWRQRGSGRVPRYSNDTPRRINATRMTRSAR